MSNEGRLVTLTKDSQLLRPRSIVGHPRENAWWKHVYAEEKTAPAGVVESQSETSL